MNDFTSDLEKHFSRIGKEIQSFVDRISIDEEEGAFHPKADMVETEADLKIFIDLPGLTKKDIQLSMKEGVLTVKGERSSPVEDETSFRRKERAYGVFSRSFALPEDADAAQIQAKFKEGVLIISLPKSDTLRNATSIPIQ